MTYRQGRRLALSILRGWQHEVMDLAAILERDGFVNHDNAPAYMRGD